MCRRDAGGEDQVGSPSLAGPSILEPARGQGSRESGITSSPTAHTQVPPQPPRHDVPHLPLPPGHCLE